MNTKRKLWELNRLSAEEFSQKEKIPIVVLLDDLRSFENVGSVFRTADAFAIEEVVLCGITPKPPHREIHKTALGATETVAWKYFSTTLEAVMHYKNQGYSIFSVEQASRTQPLHQLNLSTSEKVVLVFGNEVHGVRQDVVDASDAVMEIPQFGTKHSLNVSVCVGIVLWEFSTQLNPALSS
ncbi:MAG: TrmH family RNA methyltransferase [Flavobacteriia bacterium]|nr:TrmH family RNA methyltransferase [Flavobacteriia bacterium]